MTTMPPTAGERVRSHLRKPPADWHTCSQLARVLGLSHGDVRRALRLLASLGAVERELNDDGDLIERWRAVK